MIGKRVVSCCWVSNIESSLWYHIKFTFCCASCAICIHLGFIIQQFKLASPIHHALQKCKSLFVEEREGSRNAHFSYYTISWKLWWSWVNYLILRIVWIHQVRNVNGTILDTNFVMFQFHGFSCSRKEVPCEYMLVVSRIYKKVYMSCVYGKWNFKLFNNTIGVKQGCP